MTDSAGSPPPPDGPGDPPRPPTPAPPPLVGAEPALAPARCHNHPDNPAQYSCAMCAANICVTCAFAVANNGHICPACATKSPVMATWRKQLAWWAIGLAAFATLSTIAFIVIAGWAEASGELDTEEAETALGLAGFAGGCLPLVVGLGLSLGSLSGRGPNRPLVWVAVAWNTLMVLLWCLLMAFGTMVE